MSEKTNERGSLTGKVMSDKMNKTVTVAVIRRVPHRVYGKIIKRTTKLHVHDEKNECCIGDTVRIKEGRPISKTKAWVLAEVIEKAN